jgi:hypothetical protein
VSYGEPQQGESACPTLRRGSAKLRKGSRPALTDTQLYLVIGIPGLLALVNLGVVLALFTDLSHRISTLDEGLSRRIDTLTGAVSDLVRRLTRVEVKLGIQP